MRSVAAVAALLSAALLAGCGSGPSQVGAAAIVGDTVISIEYVQAWWERFLSDPARKEQVRSSGEYDDLSRAIVTEAVRHELLRQVAEREGLRFDEAQVSELIDELGGEQAAVEATRSFYDRSTIRDRARDQLLMVALARRYLERTTVRFDFTQAGSREQALTKARQLAAASPEQIRSIIETDARAGLQTGLGERPHLSESVATQSSQVLLFTVPARHVIAFPEQGGDGQSGQGQWTIAVLHERRTNDSPSSSPEAASVDRLSEGRLYEIGVWLLGVPARDIGIRVNPRYGAWSDVFTQVGPSEGELPAVVVPMASPQG